MPVEIRALTTKEMNTLVTWAADEGWNPGVCDAEGFQAAGAENFIGAFVDGEMLSGISAVAYGSDFGFIGLYITRPDVRGRGYGRAVFEASMARLANRTIGLDGVPEQQANYRSKGFLPNYGTTRYSGRFAGSGDSPSGSAVPVTDDHIEAMSEFDSRYFPTHRREFLKRWLELSDRALVCIEDERVAGYGVFAAALDPLDYRLLPVDGCRYLRK